MANLNLNEQIHRSLFISKESGVPVCFLSNPGFGKTTTITKYAEDNDMNLVILRGSDYEPEDILGFIVNENGEFKRLLPTWYKQLRFDKPNLLFIDEITTASDHTQAPLLSVIFDRKVGDFPLPEDTFIVAAGNYSLNLTDNFNLISPIVNRFMFVNLKATNEDIDLFLGLDETYIPFSTKNVVEFEYTEEDSKNTRTAISNLVKDLNINLNEVDIKDIYMNQEFVKNAPTPRSLYYLSKVADVMIKYDLVHPKHTEVIADGLFGYGTEDFGKHFYKMLSGLGKATTVKKTDFMDYQALTEADFLDDEGELTEIAKTITPEQLERCNTDVLMSTISSMFFNRFTKGLGDDGKCQYDRKSLASWEPIIAKLRPKEGPLFKKIVGEVGFDGKPIENN